MRELVHEAGRRWVAPALLAAAAVALFLPRLIHGLVPPALPDHGVEEMARRVAVARAVAALLATAGLGALAVRLRAHDEPARRQALAVAVVGALLAVGFALPFYDSFAADRARATYERTGTLREASGIQLEGVHNAGQGLAFEAPSSPASFARLESLPIVRGDTWLVVGHVAGSRWETFEPPRLEVEGVDCFESVHMDALLKRDNPSYSVVWRCTATTTGTTSVALITNAPDERETQLHLMTVSVLHAGFWATLDESLAWTGVLVAFGAGGLLLERRLRAVVAARRA